MDTLEHVQDETRAPSYQQWEGFNPLLAGKFYADHGAIDDAEFSQIFEDMVRVRMLKLPELDWVLFDHALSVCRHVPLRTHYGAIAAGLKIPFEGIREFCEAAIQAGNMPGWSLNQTKYYQLPRRELRIGELLVEVGALHPEVVDRCLEIKSIIKAKLGIDAAVGQIFRSVGRLSIPDFFQVLGHQTGIPFVSLNESAPAIFEAAMQRWPAPTPHRRP